MAFEARSTPWDGIGWILSLLYMPSRGTIVAGGHSGDADLLLFSTDVGETWVASGANPLGDVTALAAVDGMAYDDVNDILVVGGWSKIADNTTKTVGYSLD